MNWHDGCSKEFMMLLKKKKRIGQLALLHSLKSRLAGMDKELFSAGEPLLSMRIQNLATEVQIAIDNSEIQKGDEQ